MRHWWLANAFSISLKKLSLGAAALLALAILLVGATSTSASTGCTYQVFLPIVFQNKSGVGTQTRSSRAVASNCSPTPSGTATSTPTPSGTAVSTGTPTSVTIPPDPSSIAPQLDSNVATSLYGSTAFLYTGSNPIQTGVAPGTIQLNQAAVLRGMVTDATGAALPGVIISILDHPEFGQTVSRSDGGFDLVVNGGGILTVQYAKAGYLTVQRKANAPWQDYLWLPTVAMLQADPNVTAIDVSGASTSMQVARGSLVSGTSGTRQATLLVPPGTTASLTFPDGHTQPVSTLHVRLTEYTVGANGPAAMPGDLPVGSGYTYAAEFSADEEAAAGATGVQFGTGQSVIEYTDNFLNFSVGETVPVGYYDPTAAAWKAEANGLVVQILDKNGPRGEADLDVDGKGSPATAQEYQNLGITDAERAELAVLYSAGQSFWRVPLTHFSPWDFNWPWGPGPGSSPPGSPTPTPPVPPCKPCQDAQGADPIQPQNQSFGYDVPVAGTSFTLHYQSDRVAGSAASNQISIPLIGTTVPPTLSSITLNVQVAGQQFTQNFPPTASQSYLFTWNGKDAYGRTVQGEVPINVQIGYTYPGQYLTPSEVAGIAASTAAFGHFSYDGAPATASRSRMQVTLWKNWQGTIGKWQAPVKELGGWSLDVHHAYDPAEKVLYLGNGDLQSAQTLPQQISTSAGSGQKLFCSPFTLPLCGDGLPATNAAALMEPVAIAIGPDGSAYIADWGNDAVRKVSPDGILSTIAGDGSCTNYGFTCGDGGPATQATFDSLEGIAVGPDGSIYVADGYDIRRIDPQGTISTIAGDGTGQPCAGGACGDGGPASQATFGRPGGLAVGPDGSVYVADGGLGRVRKIDASGNIISVAGGGTGCGNGNAIGDGCPAQQAPLTGPNAVAIGPNGSLYIAEDTAAYGRPSGSRIRKVGLDGIITTVAGDGNYCWVAAAPCGDGGPATQAQLGTPTGIAVAPDGTIYFMDSDLSRVRKIDPSGIISTVAGTGQRCQVGADCDDGGPAAQGQLNGG